MVGFLDDMMDMFPDAITVVPGAPDGYGNFVESGATFIASGRIEGNARLVRDQGGHLLARDQAGRDVTSNVQVIIAGYYNLTTDRHRYTLPSRYSPYEKIQAVAVEKETDEDGPLYEILFLP